MSRRAALLALVLLLAGCAEAYRWPDRMSGGTRVGVRFEPAPEGHYVVKAGDTLYSIAFRNQLDFRDLAVWNDIGPDYLIRAGQVIRLTPPLVVSGEDGSSSIVTRPLQVPADEAGPAPSGSAPAAAGPLPASMASGRWSWPVQGPVLKRFGDDGSKGIDIGGEIGAPVRAAADGKVVYSGSALKGYGELIIVKHDDTYLTAYGNNSRRLVTEGARVSAGQAIAELGLGPEQKPALHFEVRRRGKPVDPAGFLPGR